MSKLIMQDTWIRWNPKKIFLKKNNNNQIDKFYKKQCIEKNLHTYMECSERNEIFSQASEIDEKTIENIKKEEYEKGFQKGHEICKKNEMIFKNKITKLLKDFDDSLFMHEKLLFSHVLKTVLIVSSYVVGKNINTNTSLLLQYIQKIVMQENILLKKPHLIVHPNNQTLVEKMFLDLLNTHHWTLVYDTKMDLNGCKVESQSGHIDATMDTRWKSVCKLVNSEEY